MTGDKKRGIGFIGALVLLLVALKIMGHTDLSWVFVFAPLWAGPVLFIAVAFVIAAVVAVDHVWHRLRARLRRSRASTR